MFHAAKCEDPTSQINSSVTVLGNRNLAVEGHNVMFSCPSGLMLTGPNISTCMGNGEWEPDPGELKCLGDKHIDISLDYHNDNFSHMQ